APRIAALLPPARLAEVVVTRRALVDREVGPCPRPRVAGQPLRRLAQGYRLARGPRPSPEPAAVARVLSPVHGHVRAERVELEDERRVAGREHLVVDGPGCRAEVAAEADLCGLAGIHRLPHPERDRLGGLPRPLGVLGEPRARGAMAGLAADPVPGLELRLAGELQ